MSEIPMKEEMKECRQSYWSEVDEKEKCQRLRLMVKCLQQQVQSLEDLVHQLARHEHGTGGLMIPLHSGPMAINFPRGNTRSENEGDVYF